mmetsp:Transcript_24540/g.27425  ORF Transcript_24540/g.27425 Transcript_24540/m.27425 type:complete len:97 (+) Transcript_24540:96-386(+)
MPNNPFFLFQNLLFMHVFSILVVDTISVQEYNNVACILMICYINYQIRRLLQYTSIGAYQDMSKNVQFFFKRRWYFEWDENTIADLLLHGSNYEEE